MPEKREQFVGELVTLLAATEDAAAASDYFLVARFTNSLLQVTAANGATATFALDVSADGDNWALAVSTISVTSGLTAILRMDWYPWIRVRRTAGTGAVTVKLRIAPRHKS